MEEENQTFYAHLEALKKAWKGFVEEVQKELGKWVKEFLDGILVCGNCKHWTRPEFGNNARCKIKKYLVARGCHACRHFDLIENPRIPEKLDCLDVEKACKKIKKYGPS